MLISSHCLSSIHKMPHSGHLRLCLYHNLGYGVTLSHCESPDSGLEILPTTNQDDSDDWQQMPHSLNWEEFYVHGFLSLQLTLHHNTSSDKTCSGISLCYHTIYTMRRSLSNEWQLKISRYNLSRHLLKIESIGRALCWGGELICWSWARGWLCQTVRGAACSPAAAGWSWCRGSGAGPRRSRGCRVAPAAPPATERTQSDMSEWHQSLLDSYQVLTFLTGWEDVTCSNSVVTTRIIMDLNIMWLEVYLFEFTISCSQSAVVTLSQCSSSVWLIQGRLVVAGLSSDSWSVTGEICDLRSEYGMIRARRCLDNEGPALLTESVYQH